MNIGASARIAEIYARSLLDLASQAQTADAISADLEAISTLLAQNAHFHAFLASPYFTRQAKRDLVGTVFAGKLHRLTLNFFFVLIDRERGAFLPEIVDRYRQLHRALQGYRTVSVTVAKPISEERFERLSRNLAEALHTQIDMEMRVDPSILGGVIIRYGDEMLDNSVRGRLTRTVNELLRAQKA